MDRRNRYGTDNWKSRGYRGKRSRRNRSAHPYSTLSDSQYDVDDHSSGCGSSLNHQSSGEPSILKIPGFYYDSEKKKYFKITAEHPAPSPVSSCSNTSSAEASKLTNKCQRSDRWLDALWSRSVCPTSSPIGYRRSLQKLLLQRWINADISSSQNDTSTTVSGSPVMSNHIGEVHRVSVSQSGKCLMMFQSTSGRFRWVVYRLKPWLSPSKFRLDFSSSIRAAMHIPAAAWSPDKQNPDSALLVCSASRSTSPSNSSKFMLMKLDVTDDDADLGQISGSWPEISCIARNPCNFDSYAVGLRQGVVLSSTLDSRYDEAKHFPKTDRLCPQVLCYNMNGSNLFIGCKDGRISCADLRTEKLCVYQFYKVSKYRIDDMKLLRDENYLIVSNWLGELCKYDLRMRRKVLEYIGHVNNHSALEMRLDTEQENLFMVGSDRVVRIWDVHTGRLLNSLSPSNDGSHLESNNPLPSLEWSEKWGGMEDISGLLYSDSKRLKLFDFT